MYTTYVQTKDQAVAHLFFHCCLKDGQFTEAEIKMVADLLVTAGLNKDLDLKEEVIRYRSYYRDIPDEQGYLQYLAGMIQPANELALFSYCVDLCLSDSDLSAAEEALLAKIAGVFQIPEDERRIVQKLIVQLDVVEAQQFF